MRMFRSVSLGLVLCVAGVAQAENVKKYEKYPDDLTPFKKNFPNEYKAFFAVKDKAKKEGSTRASFKKSMDILIKVVKKQPNWVDGYWRISNEAIQYGSTFNGEKDLPKARAAFVLARDYSKKCLKIDKDNPLCKFYYGAGIGKIGTVDGIFASLKFGEQVHDLWTSVLNSKYNHTYYMGGNLQSVARYGLGIYYRVVPDFFLIRWIFGISGDIDKSVKYHQEAIALGGANPSPCYRLMLTASLLCRSGGEANKNDTKQAFNIIKNQIQTSNPKSDNDKICMKDSSKLLKNPKNGCGYTMAKQQELDEEKFKEQQEGKPQASTN